MTRPEQPAPYPGDDLNRIISPSKDDDAADAPASTEKPEQPKPYPGDLPTHLRRAAADPPVHVYPRRFRPLR